MVLRISIMIGGQHDATHPREPHAPRRVWVWLGVSGSVGTCLAWSLWRIGEGQVLLFGSGVRVRRCARPFRIVTMLSQCGANKGDCDTLATLLTYV